VIKKVIEKGFAYEVNGSVYFDVQKFAASYPYGELSGKVLEELKSNSRQLEGQAEKKASFDFALWKKSNPSHIMKWESPWSIGVPGWHLECSAMSAKYLGVPFDIHGGGMDLKFPHHEGEIAQSMAAFGQNPVNYWMHNNLITIDGQKMSKSLGNFITLTELFSGNHEKLEQAYSPMTVRFFMLQAHYRSEIDFSNEALQAAEKGYQRLMNAFTILDELNAADQIQEDEAFNQEIISLCKECYEHMSDDFNTAKTIAALFEMASKINAFKNGQLSLNTLSSATFTLLKDTFRNFITEVLGLLPEKSNNDGKTDDLIKMLIDIRANARKNKDFATSDKIRDELSAIGILLKDEKTGTTSFTIDQ
jgi:cysteinyl-tRNA synthetase